MDGSQQVAPIGIGEKRVCHREKSHLTVHISKYHETSLFGLGTGGIGFHHSQEDGP